MLFAYPAAATADNWLHECLAVTLRSGMAEIDHGQPRTAWPECISADRRDRLQRFPKLQEYLDALLTTYDALSPAARQLVKEAMDDQEAVAELCSGGRRADRLDDLPAAVRGPAQLFFEKAFEMLKPLKLRDANYKKFLELVDHQMCAFCGCEYFSGAKSKREPLDHYLAVSIYPFAGANARNLVPMGTKCNSSYKGSQDIIRDQTGARRLCFDPYVASPVQVSLIASRLFAKNNGLPDWEVDLQGDAGRIETWDAVFDVKRRFIDDHLDSIYKNALKVFGTLWRKRPDVLPGNVGVCDALRHLADLSRVKGVTDRAFLETAVYELLVARCEAGGEESDRIVAEFTNAAFAVA